MFYFLNELKISFQIDDYGHWPQCRKAIDEFFVDANYTLEVIDGTGRWFQKTNNDIRIPIPYLDSFEMDPRLKKNWEILGQWHQETVTRFTGHVGKNPFQTYRYVEATRHMIQAKKNEVNEGNAIRVNVCETGFNGGHSAMLFMALFDEEAKEHIYYYGWDLKKFGSASPTANKMKETYGDHFQITWGNSRETLKEANSVLKGELCDIVVVDGDHSGAGVEHDLKNFLKVARPGTVVFSDDCAPKHKNVPKAAEMKAAYEEFVKRMEIISVAAYRNPTLKSPGFVEGLVPDKNGGYVLGI